MRDLMTVFSADHVFPGVRHKRKKYTIIFMSETDSRKHIMSEKQNEPIFRESTVKRISSPDQLTDYLKATSPGIWITLAAALCLLCGLLIWGFSGNIETMTDAKAVIHDRTAQVVSTEGDAIRAGMELRIGSETYQIEYTGTDDFGLSVGYARVDLADGSYDAQVVIESIRPVDLLLESR